MGINQFTGQAGKLPEIARDYRNRGIVWCVVGDENYGEGSSREHAALTPRFLGCKVVIARGFARIHETNLKKQGVLPLTFAAAADYEKFRADDRVAVRGLDKLAPGSVVTVEVTHADGRRESIRAGHSLTTKQIEWFRAGSALNAIGRSTRKG